MNPFEWRGPEFLFFYIVLSAIALIVMWLLMKLVDGGENPALQSPQSLVSDPYLIAHLRGGADETLRVAAMSLIDRGLLTVESDGTLKIAPNVKPEHARRAVERAILALYTTAGPATSMSSLKYATEDLQERLQSLGLMPDGAARARRWLLFLMMFGLLEGVAAIKITIGISRGRPVGFLLVLALLNIVFLWGIKGRHRTAHGDHFLENVKRLFAGLRNRAEAIHRGGATADLALLAAVFGITSVPVTVFPYRAQLMPPPPSTDSSSSSCSSSSCGGGGGCGGGGCGGCGS
ncbi:MAG TPA: TIGR04222 domain-containing membrane protein [Thermoanaerobaculia bacterium]|nr:TIGR04222 domain-containing membrane protein [Thermoanaerobaculia bacterium]